PALALSHMRAVILGLLEGHPCVRRVPIAIRARPKDRDIDAAVRPAGDCIGRHDAPDAVTISFPGAHPRNCASLHLFDDGARDVLIYPHSPLPRNRSAHALRAARARGLGKGYHGARVPWVAAMRAD